MKKYLFMAAVAGLTLTSCSQEELSVPTAENNEITFALPVVGKNTRAVTEVGAEYGTGYKFGVWAKYNTAKPTKWSEGKFYIGTDAATDNGVEAAYKDAEYGWGFDTPYYWPKNGNLSFIAYSPSTAAATVTNQGIQFKNYTVGDAADVDLLFSEVSRNKTKDDYNTVPYKGIDIQFRHALSSVRFAVQTKEAYAGTTIKVQKIEVLNAYSVGNFNQGLADTDDAVTLTTNACWAEHATERSYTAFAGDITVKKDAKYVHNDMTTPNKNTTDLILLPQALVHTVAGTTTTVTVKVTYTITSPSGNELKQETTLPLSGDWFRGNRYTYTVVFGLDEIYLEPTVDTWADVTSSPEI